MLVMLSLQSQVACSMSCLECGTDGMTSERGELGKTGGGDFV